MMPTITVTANERITYYEFEPTRTVTLGGAVELPVPHPVTVSPGYPATVALDATGDDWAWRVTASTSDGRGGIATDTWAVKVTADANLADLARLDPATFTPEELPGWIDMARGTISTGTVDQNGHLILTRTDGTTIDAGPVVGPAGAAPAVSAVTSGVFAQGSRYTLDYARSATLGGLTVLRIGLTATAPFTMAAGSNTFGSLNTDYRPPVELSGTVRGTGQNIPIGGCSISTDGNIWTTSPTAYQVNAGDHFYISATWA